MSKSMTPGLQAVVNVKWCLTITWILALLTISLNAQAAVAGQSEPLSVTTILAIASVVFSFGTNWQTIRVHGKALKDFEEWRRDYVNEKIQKHDMKLAAISQRLKIRSHDDD